MPVHTLSGDRDFRHKIRSRKCDTFAGGATQRNPTYDSVLCANPLFVEKLTKFLGPGLGRNGGCQPHSKTLCTGVLNTLERSRPGSGSAMEVVSIGRRAVQADLQDYTIAGQRSQAFRAPPAK